MAISTGGGTGETPTIPGLPGLPGGGGGGSTGQQNACLAQTGNIFCFTPNKGSGGSGSGSTGSPTGVVQVGPVKINPDGSISLTDPFDWVDIGSAAAKAAAKAANPLGTAAAALLPSSILGLSLLRLLFFILGLIAIIGAIYLFKDTRYLIERPIKTVHGAVKTAAMAAAA